MIIIKEILSNKKLWNSRNNWKPDEKIRVSSVQSVAEEKRQDFAKFNVVFSVVSFGSGER